MGHDSQAAKCVQVVSALAALDLDVRVAICDGAGENRRFLKCMMAECQPVTSRDVYEHAFMWSH